MSKPSIILIDTDKMLRDMYATQLSERFNVRLAARAQDAIDLMDKHGADAIITDTVVAKNNGVEVIHELRSYDDWAQVPIVILSSLPQRSFPNSLDWQRYNVSQFLYKPHTTPKRLMWAVSEAIA